MAKWFEEKCGKLCFFIICERKPSFLLTPWINFFVWNKFSLNAEKKIYGKIQAMYNIVRQSRKTAKTIAGVSATIPMYFVMCIATGKLLTVQQGFIQCFMGMYSFNLSFLKVHQSLIYHSKTEFMF